MFIIIIGSLQFNDSWEKHELFFMHVAREFFLQCCESFKYLVKFRMAVSMFACDFLQVGKDQRTFLFYVTVMPGNNIIYKILQRNFIKIIGRNFLVEYCF